MKFPRIRLAIVRAVCTINAPREGQAMRKVTPSMVVAIIALFVALGGGAYAASGKILGTQIKDHTVAASKLTPNALAFLKGREGPQGPEGPQGQQGATGATGATGAAGLAGSAGAAGASGGFNPQKVIYVTGPATNIPSDSKAYTLTAACPAGTKVIAGGGAPLIALQGASLASLDGSGWNLVVLNDTGITVTGAFAFAVCAAP